MARKKNGGRQSEDLPEFVYVYRDWVDSDGLPLVYVSGDDRLPEGTVMGRYVLESKGEVQLVWNSQGREKMVVT